MSAPSAPHDLPPRAVHATVPGDEPRPAGGAAATWRRGGARVLTLVGAGLLLAGLLLAGATWSPWSSGPAVVTPRFLDARVVATDWGDDGGWVLGYEDGTRVRMQVPWDGGPVLDGRLGDGPVDLVTVVGHRQRPGVLELDLALDGCEWFHERELQVLPSLTVQGQDGGTVLVLDRPLLVRSPMLWQCPDRLVDRQARDRRDLVD